MGNKGLKRRKPLKELIKDILIVVFSLSLILTSIAGKVLANSGNYNMLGSNEALGSPLLNENFSLEDWNKWEMVVWGIFLSNFAIPLIDDYNSAFNSAADYGSGGNGYKALVFGSGADNAGKENLKSLLDYAVTSQRTGAISDIFVKYVELKPDGTISDIEITDEESEYKRATFRDMMLDTKDDGFGYIDVGDTHGSINLNLSKIEVNNYLDLATINSAKLPIFYIQKNGNYEVVLDYTDSWDYQLMSAWIGRGVTSDFADEYAEVSGQIYEANPSIRLDCFGNITVEYSGSRRMVFPAASNQHLTKTPKINLLNSIIFNGVNSNASKDELIKEGQQPVFDSFNWLFGGLSNSTGEYSGKAEYSGLVAFGSKVSNIPDGTAMLYYDLDSIIQYNLQNDGELKTSDKKIHYGKAVKELFDLDAGRESGNKYTLRLELSNIGSFASSKYGDSGIANSLYIMTRSLSMITNLLEDKKENSKKMLTHLKTPIGEQELFGEPVVIPVQMTTDKVNDKYGAMRQFINSLYTAYTDGIHNSSGDIKSSYALDILNSYDDQHDMLNGMMKDEDGTTSALLASFITNNRDTYTVDTSTVQFSQLQNAKVSVDEYFNFDIDGVEKHYRRENDGAMKDEAMPGRLIKAYTQSATMQTVSNILGVRPGTKFSMYSAYIYLTYLDWYGILGSDKGVSELNTTIFPESSDILNINIEEMVEVKTEEEKKSEILNYTYMLLHPTYGRDYRNDLIMSGLTDWVYKTYQGIVYGNASSSYSSQTLATRNEAGFLNVESYSSNFLTSWFIKTYAKIAIYLIAICVICMVIYGIMKGRKISWYLLSITSIVVSIIIVPCIGEIVPAVANSTVQDIFKDKATYWGISEAIANATLERQFLDTEVSSSSLSGLSENEKQDALKLIKSMNVVYLDRTLMLKMDISRKITSATTKDYESIQNLKSTRWLLPMIMRQFTGNNKTADYVYIPLGDLYDDLSNSYWYLKPEDALGNTTINSMQQTESGKEGVITDENLAKVGNKLTLQDRLERYPDYKDTTQNSFIKYEIPYKSVAYKNSYAESEYEDGGKELEELPHTYFYLINNDASFSLLDRVNGFNGESSDAYENYLINTLQQKNPNDMKALAYEIERTAGNYDRYDRSTVGSTFGYLWATESPYYYIYQSIKDSFNTSDTLATIIGKIQGDYLLLDNGQEARISFMHAGKTGYVRDILDLEEMFTNMIPYLYQMQITAGGFDGESGLLGDSKITEYDIYKENNQSWLFRSNWVTKLMESGKYDRPERIRDKDGNKYTVDNPMLADRYPAERPMVFSEAQMHAQGLDEADLTLIELKLVELNKTVADRWVLLLNYANLSGMNKETLLRQMATEATLEFNRALSPSTFNNSKSLYPIGLDLRSMSFDSIMKMLVINITKDSSFIYGDTMKGIIETSDLFTSLLLLLAAFLCAYIIPLVRTLALGLLFYLSLASVIYNIFASNRRKGGMLVGTIASSLIFLFITLIYYLVFSALMTMTSSDNVLTVDSIQANVGNPVWLFIIIILVSIAYIVALLYMSNFCIRHFRDMGLNAFKAGIEMISSTVGQKINGFMDKFTSGAEDLADGNIGRATTKINTGDTSVKVTVENGHMNVDIDSEVSEDYKSKGDDYIDNIDESYRKEIDDADEINREIEQGKKK